MLLNIASQLQAKAMATAKSQRILVLMHEWLVPPDDISGMSAEEIAPFRTEYDVVSTLRSMGHNVRPLGLRTELSAIGDAITDFAPHICFNLCEEFDGISSYDQHVVSALELLRQPYTGCNPRGLTLARDKALTKKILAYHNVNVPQFVVFPRAQRSGKIPTDLPYPMLVKTLAEEGSVGIAQASLVYDEKQLIERVAFIHDSVGADAIAEQFIAGRELYVAVLGNRRLQCMPIWELCFDKLPPDAPRIATSRAKWDIAYQARHGIYSQAAEGISTSLRNHIFDMSRMICREMDLTGYNRIDFRLNDAGEVYLLEANPNPQIARGEDFAESAAAAGISYEALLQKIITLGLTHSAKHSTVAA